MTTHVFLERAFDVPMSTADVYDCALTHRSCFVMHRVEWQSSYLRTDGRRMVCWFTAPDAESARLALRQSGAHIDRLWPGTVHNGRHATDPNVMVERGFAAPVSLEQVHAIEDAGVLCLKAHQVRFSRTFFSFDGRRMLCLYEAPDAESVRLAQREAGVPFDAVWPITQVAPPSPV